MDVLFDAPQLERISSPDAFCTFHRDAYIRVMNECCTILFEVWSEIGVHAADVHSKLTRIDSEVTNVWQSAVDVVREQRDTLVKQIRETEVEIRTIYAQLGEEAAADFTKAEGQTLQERLDQTVALRNRSADVKKYRIAEFVDILAKINVLRKQLGHDEERIIDFDSPKCTVTKGDWDYLKSELDALLSERTRRLARLESLWRTLKAVCSDLGQDPLEVAKAVHPSLEFSEHIMTGLAHASFDRLPSLSETSLSALEERLKLLIGERSRREEKLAQMKETLLSLWEALQTSLDDLDRNRLTHLMEGPIRLHPHTFERVREEIYRQEIAKSRILKDLIHQKIEEIRSVCEAGHLPLPEELHGISDQRDDDAGYCAEVLKRLTRMVTTVTSMVERRAEISTMIEELEASRSEVDWLVSYERDGNRYRGRDCNRKLQRAIKAGRIREKLPFLVEKLLARIMDWENSENQPFLYNGVDYRRQVLDTYELQPKPKPKKTGSKIPSIRRSAIPEISSPSQSACGTAKRCLTPSLNSKSVCFGEGRSMIARPQTSLGPTPKNDNSHLFKNAQTDYHPLQERLDRMLSADRKTTTLEKNTRSRETPSAPAVVQGLEVDVQRRGDDDMEDVICHTPQTSLPPPPRRHLDSVNKAVMGYPDPFHRRPTF